MHVELTTEALLAHVRELEAKARAFDDLAEAIADAAGDFTRYTDAYYADYNQAMEKERAGEGSARLTLQSEFWLGKAQAYRLASEVLGDLVALAGVE